MFTVRRRRVVLALLLVLVAAVGTLVRHGFARLETQPWDAPDAAADVPALRTAPIAVETLQTAVVKGDRCVVLDPEDPSIDRMQPCVGPAVVVTHLVRHATKGDFLIDGGLSTRFASEGGNYTALLSAVLAGIGAEVSQDPGSGTAAQLERRGITANAVFVTHLHADHTSGIADLPASVPVVFDARENTFLARALMGPHLDEHPLRTLHFDQGDAVDLLGDGSLWALSTPGHSPGHVSYLVSGDPPTLITGDAVAYATQFEHRIRPSPNVHDPDAAARSLHWLADFAQARGISDVRFGHDFPKP